jgi:hypothetical protein
MAYYVVKDQVRCKEGGWEVKDTTASWKELIHHMSAIKVKPIVPVLAT